MEVRNLRLRKEAFDRAGRCCEKCGTFKGIQVHYRTIPSEGGEEELANTTVLCPHCYREFLFFTETEASFEDWISLPPAPVVVQFLLESPEHAHRGDLCRMLRDIAEEARKTKGFWWDKHHRDVRLF